MSDQEPSQPPHAESARLPIWWWIAIAIAFLARMYVVADDEIVPRTYDSAYYAQSAAYYFSDEDPYSIFPTHRPGMPILAWLVAELGVSYKLFLDIAMGAAAILAGVIFHRLTSAKPASFLLTMAVMWHPYFMLHSRMFMTEPLVTIMLLLVLISSVQFIYRPVELWSIGLTLVGVAASSIYVLARNEFLVLFGFYAVVFAIVLIRHRHDLGRKMFTRRGGWRLILLAMPVLLAWGAEQTLKIYHQSRFGVNGLCATEADGFSALMGALYSIEPDQETRFVPVPYTSLVKACEHSPMMARHKDLLLNKNRGVFSVATRIFGTEGEVAAWLNWHLVDCFHGVDRNSNKQMKVAAREIRQAIKRGDIQGRRARFPIDPVWEEWLPLLPNELWTALKASTVKFDPALALDFARYHLENSVDRSFFDIGLLRRGGTGFNRTFAVSGRCCWKETQVTSAQILTAENELVVEVPLKIDAEGFPSFGITLSDADNFNIRKPLALRLVRDGAASSLSSIESMIGKDRMRLCYINFQAEDQPPYQEQWLLSYNRHAPTNETRRKVRAFLNSWQSMGLLIVSIVAVFSGFFLRPDRRRIRNVAWVGLAGLAFLLGRCMYYSLVNLWLGWGLHRYIHPNVYLAIFSAACLGFVLGALLRRPCSRQSHSQVTSEA